MFAFRGLLVYSYVVYESLAINVRKFFYMSPTGVTEVLKVHHYLRVTDRVLSVVYRGTVFGRSQVKRRW